MLENPYPLGLTLILSGREAVRLTWAPERLLFSLEGAVARNILAEYEDSLIFFCTILTWYLPLPGYLDRRGRKLHNSRRYLQVCE